MTTDHRQERTIQEFNTVRSMTPNGDLFKSVRFCILSPVQNGVTACLRQLQATDNGQYLNELVTHVICDDPNHVRLSEAVDLFDISTIVTSRWVLWCVRCKSLLPTAPFSPSYRSIFSDCVFGICTNKISVIDQERLWCMVRYYDGLWSSKLSKCTHIIATESMTLRGVHIVSPDYVTKCIEANAKLPEEEFDPRNFIITIPCTKNRVLTPTMDYNWREDLITSSNLTNTKEKFLENCHFYFVDYEYLLPESELKEWRDVIDFYGGVVEQEFDPSIVTYVICEHRYSNCYKLSLADGRPRLVTAYWLNDIISQRCVSPPWLPYHFPLVFPTSRRSELPLRSHVIAVTGFDGEERNRLKIMIALLGGKYTGELTPLNSILIAHHMTGQKCLKAVEWNIPIVNSQWLVEILLGNRLALRKPIHKDYTRLENVNHFGIDRCFVEQFLPAWRQKENSLFSGPAPTSSEKDSVDTFNNKKWPEEPKTEEVADITATLACSDVVIPESFVRPCCNDDYPVITLTGYSRRQADELLQMISSLGGRIADHFYETTHLVARNFVRTLKLMKCINYCTYVLNCEWIFDSYKEGKFLKPAPSHMLSDEDVSYAYGLRLSCALNRKDPAFKGLTFYCTPSVDPPANVLYSIVVTAGANVCYHLPSLTEIEELYNGKNNFIVLSCANDLVVFQDCLSKGLTVLSVDFVLDNIFRSVLNYDLYMISLDHPN